MIIKIVNNRSVIKCDILEWKDLNIIFFKNILEIFFVLVNYEFNYDVFLQWIEAKLHKIKQAKFSERISPMSSDIVLIQHMFSVNKWFYVKQFCISTKCILF